jgi:nitroreductase
VNARTPGALPPARCDAFAALATRRSVRAFRPDEPVDRATIEQILALAARAPSGSNLQPWKVHVLAGAARARFCARVMQAHENGGEGHEEEYAYYPREWFEPYLSRRRKLGKDLYTLTGVARGDVTATKRQLGRNYLFFDAPVGLMICIDRRLEVGSWLDLGAFLMGIMVAARGVGLHTCPQQAFARYHRLIRAELGIPEHEVVVCGMAIGYEDTAAAESRLVTERTPVAEFATFHES